MICENYYTVLRTGVL